jgi:hypothetical protein
VQALFIELAWKINKNERGGSISCISRFLEKKGGKRAQYFEGRAITVSKSGVEIEKKFDFFS